MIAVEAELTRQNQELTRKITLMRQCNERYVKGQAQSQKFRKGENAKHENQSRGTASRRVPHLKREMDHMRKTMDEMRKKLEG